MTGTPYYILFNIWSYNSVDSLTANQQNQVIAHDI